MHRLLVVLLVVSALLMPAAGADEQRIEDERNENERLDLVAASHSHDANNPNVLVHTLEFAEAPDFPRELHGAILRIEIPNGKRGLDRQINVFHNSDESLTVRVHGVHNDNLRGFGNAYWVDETTLRIEFARRTLRLRVPFYRWRASILYPCTPPPDPEIVCSNAVDQVPNTGKIRHRL